MSVENRYSIARGGDSQIRAVIESRTVGIDRAEDLLRFRLQFVFLARDVGDDVVEDVHAADAGISGSGNGLHGHDTDLLDGSEARLDGGDGDDETDHGAVGVAD